jgi:hypothetical protein
MAPVYAGTRAAELTAVPWTDEQKAAFVQTQFAAQARHDREHYPGIRSAFTSSASTRRCGSTSDWDSGRSQTGASICHGVDRE